MNRPRGVSFVVPVHNGRRWLPRVIDAIQAQRDGRPFEIIVVDDGGADGSSRWLRRHAAARGLTVIAGPGRGAAAAVNAGIREARHPIVCQVDQDVVVHAGWLPRLMAALEDPDVAAAQGRYITAPDAGFWARVMGRDLEWRYARMQSGPTDHVCTGNTAYRTAALHAVGLLDEGLGYGYDNDVSYRLAAAGYRLAFCYDASSTHHWREGFRPFLTQQFGVGYGRLDVVARHPRRAQGDRVSNAIMMAHAPVTLLAAALLLASGIAALAGVAVPQLGYAGAGLLGILAAERARAGIAAWRLTRDPVPLAFSLAHLARDLAWCAAIVCWTARRLAGRTSTPAHSMRRREGTERATAGKRTTDQPPVLIVVPAFNEAENLARVVADLRRHLPTTDVLVVNDGSSDGTRDILPALGVEWLTMPARVGVGGAVRAGLRYALDREYTHVVRIDGDGQHRASDVARLLEPVLADRLDAVMGSRFVESRRRRPTVLRGAQALLALCLSAATRRRITDPTSGFCVFGPRAVRLMAWHHPTGYPEPELILLAHRSGLRMGEVPVRVRRRLKGRTSLTPVRAVVAIGRTLLALVIVPIAQTVAERGETA